MNTALLAELSKQSEKIIYYTDGGYTEVRAVDMNTFAKLIVQECAKVASTAEPYQTSDLILKHFGVIQ